MTAKLTTCLLLAFALSLASCGTKEEPQSEPGDGDASTSKPEVKTDSNPLQDAGDAIKDAAGDAEETIKQNTEDAADAVSDMTDDATDKVQNLTDDATAKAKSMLEQLLQYIKDNKFELADKTLAALDGMKASLPESLQQQIDNARAALTAKKASSGDVGGLGDMMN